MFTLLRIFGVIGPALVVWAMTASPAAADVDLVTPITTWNVDWSSKVCTLRRGFGERGKADIVWIERFGPTDDFYLTIISDRLGGEYETPASYVTFGSQAPVKIPQIMRGTTAKKRRTVFLGSLTLKPRDPNAYRMPTTERPDPAFEASISTIQVRVGFRTVVFKLAGLDKPFAALRACTDNLVRTWGLDPAEQAALANLPQPTGSPATWITAADYPMAMVVRSKQAIVNFRLSVNEQGYPTGCEVQRSVNDKIFDDLTCTKLMHRARFQPAHDMAGNAVLSYFISQVRFVLP